GLNVHVIQFPAPDKYRPRIKRGCDTASADRFHRLLSVGRLKTFALRGQGAGPPNSRVSSAGEMQTFRGFIFHGLTKGVALDVMREQRTKEQSHAGCGGDHEEDRNRSSVDQQFSSQDGKKLRKSKSNDDIRMMKENVRTPFRHLSIRASFVIRHSRFVIPFGDISSCAKRNE